MNTKNPDKLTLGSLVAFIVLGIVWFLKIPGLLSALFQGIQFAQIFMHNMAVNAINIHKRGAGCGPDLTVPTTSRPADSKDLRMRLMVGWNQSDSVDPMTPAFQPNSVLSCYGKKPQNSCFSQATTLCHFILDFQTWILYLLKILGLSSN